MGAFVYGIYYYVVHWNEGRCVCVDTYDLVLGCIYGVAYHELHTCIQPFEERHT
jgi:hypothetical protein